MSRREEEKKTRARHPLCFVFQADFNANDQHHENFRVPRHAWMRRRHVPSLAHFPFGEIRQVGRTTEESS